MADNFVEELLVGLGFEFEGEEGEEFKKQTEVIASTINKISIAAGVATAALFAMAKASAGTNDELGKTANTLDTSAESLARWKQAAELAGVPGEDVVNMLERLKTAAQDATRTGTGPFQAYAELGVDFEALSSGALDVADGLDTILANARKMDKSLAQSALRELGIDVRLLELTGTDIQDAFSEVDKFSGVTTELAEASADFNNEWQRVQLRLAGTANELTARLLPALTDFLITLQNGLEWLQTTGLPILDKVVETMGGWENVLIGLAAAAGLSTFTVALTTILKLVTSIGGGLASLGPALAVAAAGAGGIAIGTAISENLSDETNFAIGEAVAKTLAFFGNEEAQRAVAANEALAFSSAGDIVNNQTTISNGASRGRGPVNMTTNNTFNGLKQVEMEAMLSQQEQKQNEFLDDDANDSIVR